MILLRNPMTLFMLAVFTTMVGVALTYPAGARFMPLTIGIPAIGLCLLQVYLDLRRKDATTQERDEIREAEEKASRVVGHEVHFEHVEIADVPTDPRELVRREVIAWSYFLGFVVGILLFGFWISIPIFLISFLRERAKASWTKALLLGGTASIAFYLIFTKGLGVTLHQGLITGWIVDRMAG